MKFTSCIAMLGIILLSDTTSAPAASFEVLHYFTMDLDIGNAPDGAFSYSKLAFDGVGTFYGTTSSGGDGYLGTLFKYDVISDTFTTLHGFSGADGHGPGAGVVLDSLGNLYGTTILGGSHNNGTLFKFDGSTITTLYDFDANDGSPQYAGVAIDGSGNLYGTTQNGGANGFGMLYKFDGTSLTSLFDFVDASDPLGANPIAGVTIDSLGNLYGTTTQGGLYSSGTIFKYDGTSLTTLVDLQGSVAGELTLDGAGNLYGTAYNGGAYGYGQIFMFDGTNLTTLYSFDNVRGDSPTAGPTMDSAGNLYGTTLYGGDNSAGVVYKFDGANLTVLHHFDYETSGANPYGGVTLDAWGNLYGTTWVGGAHVDYDPRGTLYRLTGLNSNESIPEPSTLALLGIGTLSWTMIAHRRRRAPMTK